MSNGLLKDLLTVLGMIIATIVVGSALMAVVL